MMMVIKNMAVGSSSGGNHGADGCTVTEPREAKRRRVHQRRIAGDQVGSQLAGSWADAETMAGETGGQKQPWQGIHSRDDRNGVRGGINQACPTFGYFQLVEKRKGLGQVLARPVQHS